MDFSRNIRIVVTLALLLMGEATWANGDSGCGLGGVIISRNTQGLQLLSWTTNNTFFSQPLGITFGTSGCSSRGLVMKEKEVEYFVEINRSEIIQEMAQGQGEKLATLSKLSGCQSPGSIQEFSSFTQKNFSKIVPDEKVSSAQMIRNLMTMANQDEKVLQDCKKKT